MKLLTSALVLFTSLCLSWPAAGAEKPLVIELWPGKVPDETGDMGPEKVRMSPKLTRKEVEVTEPTRLLTNVSKPTITVYRPAKDKDTGAAILICPGGGYWDLYWELEGEEVAAWLNSQGVTGFLLKYRVPRRPDEPKGEPARRPLQDAQRAVSLVRSKARDWNLDPKRIGIMGFSAGGHLAIATATGFEKRTYPPIDEIDTVSCRPDFAIAAYSGYLKARDKEELAPGLRIPPGTPPIFLVHGGADVISPPENSVLVYLALKRAGIPAELHIYAGAAHDFAVRKVDHPCATWMDRCVEWLRRQGFLVQDKTDEGLRKELADRVKEDQEARRLLIDSKGRDAELTKKLTDIDRRNTAWLKDVVDKHGWPGKSLVGEEGAHNAWLLVQHADRDRPFQKRCLELLQEAVKKGEASGKDLAYLTDRVLVGEGKKQLYGTQFTLKDGEYVPSPIEDEANVDKRRKEVGLESLAEYARTLREIYKSQTSGKK